MAHYTKQEHGYSVLYLNVVYRPGKKFNLVRCYIKPTHIKKTLVASYAKLGWHLQTFAGELNHYFC